MTAIDMTWRGKSMGAMTSDGQLLDSMLIMAHREAAYDTLLEGHRALLDEARANNAIAGHTIIDLNTAVQGYKDDARRAIEANQCLRMEEFARHTATEGATLKKYKTPFWTTFMQVFFCVCVGYSMAYIGQHLDVLLIRCELPVWELNGTWWPW